MTVRDLIRKLIDCPMEAEVSFVGHVAVYTDDSEIEFDYEVDTVKTLESQRYVELSA